MKIKLLLVLLCAQTVYSLNPIPLRRRSDLERGFNRNTVTLLGLLHIIGGEAADQYQRFFIHVTGGAANRQVRYPVRIIHTDRIRSF